jgi:thioredoxin
MKIVLFGCLVFGLFILSNCAGDSKPSSPHLLSPSDYAEKIIELPAAPIIDIRSLAEFSRGHLQNAVSLDFKGIKFLEQVSKLDKTKPVFIYGLNDEQSHAALNKMYSMDFKVVYELEGGFANWQSAKLPIVTNTFTQPKPTASGMSNEDFEQMLESDKIVLVDFYADWCAPCRQMKPDLDAIATDMKDKVKLIIIDSDHNPQLCKDLDVVSLPTLMVYKNKKLTWVKQGLVSKDEIIKQLK